MPTFNGVYCKLLHWASEYELTAIARTSKVVDISIEHRYV